MIEPKGCAQESAISAPERKPRSWIQEDRGCWQIVSFAGDCLGGDPETGELGETCAVCEGDYEDCPCPGPTQEGYEYAEFFGVMMARRVPIRENDN